MPIRYKRVTRIPGFDKTKTERTWIAPDRATPVSFKDVCTQVSLTSGINPGNVTAALEGLSIAIKTFARQGHSVQINGLGTFVPSFNAKSTLKKEEADAQTITRMKLNFIPCKELKDMMNSIEIVNNDPAKPKENSEDKPDSI